ncbi:MAG: carboxypeptidase regulatory-like domain-containing protein, partial [Actinomycetota bacterium]
EPLTLDIDLPEFEDPFAILGDQDPDWPAHPFSGLLVFNGNIGFLHQFFSITFIVVNNAPAGSPITLKDLTATISLTQGLREVRTIPAHLAGTTLPVRCPGPDGQIGTSDDQDVIIATLMGQAEFLAEGIKTGTHTVTVDFNGTIGGLTIGEAPVKGSAKGMVVVRDPELTVTFSHPSVVRQGEEYDLYVTLTNTSSVDANLVHLSLPKTRQVGARLLTQEQLQFETILPGESASGKFRMLALQTGRVTATAFAAEGSLSGSFVLTAGVGEMGIPLSPDTLVMPTFTSKVPADVLDAGMLLLGEAYSISVTPLDVLPEHLPYVRRNVVQTRAYELAGAGQRVDYGETWEDAMPIMLLDWLGNRNPDMPFDQLRRLTTKGERVAEKMAGYMNTSIETRGFLDYLHHVAGVASYREPFLLAGLSTAGAQRPCHLRLVDALENRLEHTTGGTTREIPFAEYFDLRQGTSGLAELAVAGRLDEAGLRIEVAGDAPGYFDLVLVVPDSTGGYREVRFQNVESRAGMIATVAGSAGAQAFVLGLDWTADGTVDQQVNGQVTTIVEPSLQLISAVQDCTVDPMGQAVSLFFNRDVDETLAKNVQARYQVPGKSVLSAFVQHSPRIVLLGLDNPVSPFVESRVIVTGMKDRKGLSLASDPAESVIRPTIQAEGGIVFGQVVGPDGNALPGISVRLMQDLGGSHYRTSSTRTDSNGDYQFDFVQILQNPFVLDAVDEANHRLERVRARIWSHGERLNINLMMRGTGSVRGRVMLGSTPVPGIYVQAVVENLGDMQAVMQSSTYTLQAGTDVNGEFYINNVPLGRVSLYAATPQAQGSLSLALSAPGETANVELRLYAGKTGTVRGRVLSSARQPVPTQVMLRRSGSAFGVVRTDDLGEFQFEQVPLGLFTLEALNPRTNQVGGTAGGNLLDGVTPDVTILMQGGGTIRGRVVGPDGLPRAGIVVYIEGTALNTITPASGEFEFTEIPPGQYTVTAADMESKRKVSSPVSIAAEGQVMRVSLVFVPEAEIRRGGVSGRVFFADGTPAVRQQIILFDRWYRIRGSVRTNDIGGFAFQNLEEGGYGLVSIKGSDGGVGSFTLQFPGHFVVSDLRYRGNGEIGVKTLAEDGVTPVMADVEFQYQVIDIVEGDHIGFWGRKMYATTNASGENTFRNVLAGDFSLAARSGFYPNASYYYGRLASGEKPVVQLKFNKQQDTLKGKVRVRVLNPAETEVLKIAKVSLQYGGLPPQELFEAVENADYYEFSLVPPGYFTITVEDQVNGYKAQTFGSMGYEGQTVSLDVRLKGKGTVRGQVRTLAGDPVRNARVTLSTQGYPQERFTATSDIDGRFVFNNVTENTLSLTAYDQATNRGGGAAGSLAGDGAETAVDIVLEATTTVSGRVLSVDGATAVAGAQVALYHYRSPYPFGFGLSDASGNYIFQYVPVGDFRLEAYDMRSGRKGKAWGRVERDGQTLTLDVRLEGRGTVSGTFYDGSHTTGIPGATVKLKNTGNFPYEVMTTSDDYGRFMFHQVGEGTFELRAEEKSTGQAGSASGRLEYDGQEYLIDIQAAGTGSVRGVVYMPDGHTPVSFARVTVTSGGRAVEATADTGGAYSVQMVPLGAFKLQAVEQNGRRWGVLNGYVEFHGDEVQADVVMQGLGAVSGAVRDGAGVPQPDVSMTLWSDSELGGESFYAATDETGAYRFDRIRKGSVRVSARHPISGLGASGTGTVAGEGDEVRVDLQLAAVGTVRGLVKNADLTPAANATVTLSGTNYTRLMSTYEDGSFEYTIVPLGAFSIFVEGYNHSGCVMYSGSLSAHGQVANTGTLVLDGDLPQISSVAPPNGSVDIPLNTVFTVVFSKQMNASSLAPNVALYAGNNRLGVGVTLAADLRTMTVTPSHALAGASQINLVVGAQVQDLSGNRLYYDYSFRSTTIDNVPPVVSSVVPPNNAIQVAPDSQVVVRFSEPLDPALIVNGSFTLTRSGGSAVTGIKSFSENNSVLTFRPDLYLDQDARYDVQVAGYTDLRGNVMSQAYSSGFYTTDTVAPSLTLAASDGPNVKEKTKVSVTGDVGGATDVVKVHYYVDGALQTSVSASPWLYELTVRAAVPEGDNTVLVEGRAEDRAGNLSAPASIELTIVSDDPPVVTMTGPATTGVKPRDSVSFQVTANDDVKLQRVELLAIGPGVYVNLSRTVSSAQYSGEFIVPIPYNVAPQTEIIVVANAVDSTNQGGASPAVTLQVPEDTQTPSIQLTSPADATQLHYRDQVTIHADASDDLGVKEVRFYAGETLLATDTEPPFETVYTTPAVQVDTAVQLRATAVDVANKTADASVSVTALMVQDSDTPELQIATPTRGLLVYARQKLQITVSASDDLGIDKVELSVNGVALPELTAEPYRWDYVLPSDLADGSQVQLTARATDVAGKIAEHTVLLDVKSGVVVPVGAVIEEGNTAYENKTLIVKKGAVTINGSHQFQNLIVAEDGRVAHQVTGRKQSGRLNLTIAGNLSIASDGRISADALGYLGGLSGANLKTTGITRGNSETGGSGERSGGSYGGYGAAHGTSLPNAIYGSAYEPDELGSGGGANGSDRGGNGGGLVRVVSGTVVLDGSITANGENVRGGGGSGGSIRIEAQALRGAGRIAADGGKSDNVGAGGGGRVAVYYTQPAELDFARATALGGRQAGGTNAALNGAPGTVLLQQAGQTAQLRLDNGGVATNASTDLPGGRGTITSLRPDMLEDSQAAFVP